MKIADLRSSLEHISQIFPAKKILYIGSKTARFSDIESALNPEEMLRIDPALAVTGNENVTSLNGGIPLETVLSAEVGRKTVYMANSLSFSGLIRPEALQPYWRNLATVEEKTMDATTLDRLVFAESDKVSSHPDLNWLIVDVLPAGCILAGASALLKSVEGVVVRVLYQEDSGNELRGCGLTYVNDLLIASGFKPVFQSPDLHKSFLLAGYARDWKVTQARLQKSHAAQISALESDYQSVQLIHAKERDSLEGEARDLEAALSESRLAHDAESKVLFAKINDLETALQNNESTYEAACTAQEIELNELRDALSRNQKAYEAELISLNATLSDNQAAYVSERTSLVARTKELEATLAETQNARANLGLQVDDLGKKVLSVSKQLSKAEALYDATKTQLDTAQAEKKSLVEKVEKRLVEGEQQRREIASTMGRLSEDVTRVSADIDENRYLQLTALRRSKRGLTDSLLVKADRSYAAEKFKKSAEYYQAIVTDNKSHAWAMQGLAESLARMDYQTDPNWYDQERATAIEETGKWDVTVRLYREALKLDPGISVAFNNRFLATDAKLPTEAIENPVFIVGCGHSGTSIMLRILGNHSNFMPIPKETATFLKDDSTVRYRMKNWDLECKAAGAQRWIEKTPPHIFQIQRFLSFRPKAQFILMVRDGRDVVCSLRKRAGYEGISDRLDRWVYDNQAGLAFWDHPQVRVVKYEDFVASPSDMTTDICAFLGEEPKEGILDYHEDDANWYSDRKKRPKSIRDHSDHLALRNWQINQPIFDGRGKWEKDMTPEEKEAFKKSPAQELLERFEYVQGQAW